MSSILNKSFYIIGAFEAPHFDYFPTHLQPIIVEKTTNGFQRWAYTLEKPYAIKPRFPIGSANSLEMLFPVKSFIILDNPVLMQKCSQLVAIGPKEFLISSSRVMLVLKLGLLIIMKSKNSQYRRRAWITIRNLLL